jgi:hypothetical protein
LKSLSNKPERNFPTQVLERKKFIRKHVKIARKYSALSDIKKVTRLLSSQHCFNNKSKKEIIQIEMKTIKKLEEISLFCYNRIQKYKVGVHRKETNFKNQHCKITANSIEKSGNRSIAKR